MTVSSPHAPKKGLSPLAWVGIGCGVLLVIALIGFLAFGFFVKRQVEKFGDNPSLAAAEMIVRLNPELEVVESDREAGTLTIREKATGKTMTVNAEDVEEGRISFETEEGTVTMESSEEGGTWKMTGKDGEEATFEAGGGAPKDLPSWMPVYPGGTIQGTFDATGPEGRNVSFTVMTKDSPEDVIEFYESKLEEAGLTVEKTTYQADGETGGTLTGTSEDQKSTVQLIVGSDAGTTTVIVSLSESK
jgi:hypothetical protein